MDPLINHQLGQVVFLFACLIILVTNIRLLSRFRENQSPSLSRNSLPRVSVLLPARNEESNIQNCVESLLKQDYPDFEIVVLNDLSQDKTGTILNDMACQWDRLVLLDGKETPAGWNGKNWACHQLSQAASGDVLLFTDADTYHKPEVLTHAIRAMLSNHADFITAFPLQEVRTLGEKLLVPSLYWCMHTFIPLALAYRLQASFLAVALGQFLLIHRIAYDAIGGHSAIRNQVTDDLALVRRIKSRGFRWRAFDATQNIHCRMYHGFGEAFSGFTKNIFAVFECRILPFLFVWIWIAAVFLEPPIVILLRLLNVPISVKSIWLAAFSIVLALAVWGLILWYFRFPFWIIMMYPLMVLLMEVVAITSMFTSLLGQATWKGRPLQRQKFSWW